MSHFTVLVIGEDVEEQLEPFQEGYGDRGDKWDWYVIGGRWSGYFKMKKGTRGNLGKPGVFDNKAPKGTADQARVKDIDFEGMYADAEKQAHESYDAFEKATAGIEPPPCPWDEFRQKYTTIEEAREAWNGHPWCKALQENGINLLFRDPYVYFRVNTGGREAFVNARKKGEVATHAVIKDGEWYESGEMGWWGIVFDEKAEDQWQEEFYKLLDGLDENTLLTLVDCHI